MSIRKIPWKIKKELKEKTKREFPGNKGLQDIHYYRYLKEIEWQKMSPSEIVQDIKRGAGVIKKEIENL